MSLLHTTFEACCGSLVAVVKGQLYVYVATVACWMPDNGPEYPQLHTLVMTEFVESLQQDKKQSALVDAVLHHTTPTVLALASHLLHLRLSALDLQLANARRLVPLQQNLVLDADTCSVYCRLPDHGFLFAYPVHWHANSLREERKCAQWFVSSFGVSARHMALCLQHAFLGTSSHDTIVLEGSAAARRRVLDVLALLLGTRLQRRTEVVATKEQRRVVYSEPHDPHDPPPSGFFLQHWQFVAMTQGPPRAPAADRVVLQDDPTVPSFTDDDSSVLFSYLMAFV